jgi:hypothetical protein
MVLCAGKSAGTRVCVDPVPRGELVMVTSSVRGPLLLGLVCAWLGVVVSGLLFGWGCF